MTYTIAVEPPRDEADQVDSVRRMLAISDIHGDFKSFSYLLIAAQVVDSSLRWRWGDGHLVIVGDVFDRGPAVTECLWLVYRLEQEAAVAGGAVHYLLGNHEMMILRGDLRYVNERYTVGIAKRSRFAYSHLFGPETELGRWLRTKNTVVRLDRTLFVHGGVLPEQLRTFGGIAGINDLIRRGLDYSSVRLNFEVPTKLLYGTFGPLWYRGYTEGVEGSYEPAKLSTIDSVLQLCDVDQIVVGHTEHDSLTVYHGGEVLAIDVDVEARGGQQGLLWQDGHFYRVDNHGVSSEIPGH